jgi:hypothetical protein
MLTSIFPLAYSKVLITDYKHINIQDLLSYNGESLEYTYTPAYSPSSLYPYSIYNFGDHVFSLKLIEFVI